MELADGDSALLLKQVALRKKAGQVCGVVGIRYYPVIMW